MTKALTQQNSHENSKIHEITFVTKVLLMFKSGIMISNPHFYSH